MSHFKNDLDVGKDAELYDLEVFSKNCKGELELAENGQKYCDILININGDTKPYLECKSDLLHLNTGNAFIEYSCNGHDSGILRTKAPYYSYHLHFKHNEKCLINSYVFRTKKLKEFLKHKNYRTVSGGDGGRVKGWLVPSKELITMQGAIRYSLNRKCGHSIERHGKQDLRNY